MADCAEEEPEVALMGGVWGRSSRDRGGACRRELGLQSSVQGTLSAASAGLSAFFGGLDCIGSA